jgi:gluconokinase
MLQNQADTRRFDGVDRPRPVPRVIVVMGVSGSGKTVVGRRLAAALGARFHDADDLHPPENVARMRSGTPLTDADREPWLNRLGDLVDGALAADGPGVVLACSALKRAYRRRLRVDDPLVRLVHLAGPESVIRARIAARTDHYMPASLLPSQLAALEPPGADENPLVVQVADTPDQIAAAILAALGVPGGRHSA